MIGTAKVYCELLPDRTVITLDEFPEYGLLELANYIEDYTVYFAEDCKFPSPNDGDIIVEKSIPLYRFLAGKTKEKVVFAMKGTNYKWVICNYWPVKDLHMYYLKVPSLSNISMYVF
ncbi:unnamed protein product [Hymenolepis diminuta]|uniref:DUF5727 domain-containing protein n=1 Tax=Hymenolepis diminuta TaxID=6216 RepID=A0A564Z9R3_HYMDI|nr:unnamed protein product [Hymenolepis diminuta]